MSFYQIGCGNLLRCTGIEEAALIGGLALSAAGTGTSIAAGQQQKNQMNAATEADLQAQQQYQKQGQSLLNENIAKSTAPVAQSNVDTGTQQTSDAYSKVNAVPLTSSAGNSAIGSGQTSNNIVGQDAKAQTQLSNSLAAPLQGYNDWQVGQWINNLQTNTALNQLNTNAANRNSVLGLQMNDAQSDAAGLGGIGSLLGTTGGLLSLYGATSGAPKTALTPLSSMSQYPMANGMLSGATANSMLGNWAASPGLSSLSGY